MKNKSILITGGTGSLGKALTRHILTNHPEIKRLVIFSRDEQKQFEMEQEFSHSKYPSIRYFIGDVRDFHSVDEASVDVDYIFHAAALKQVPSCEFFPIQAVKTNILGTENVLNAAKKNKVKKVVVLSTDKAAYPVNVMGMTKALMERVMIAKSRNLNDSSSIFCGTRYGNVIGSRGSVIPLFIDQIKKNKDLTITNPEMTRFIMTLEDAVELVNHAFNKGQSGEIFVQKAPAVKLKTLAQALIKLYNSKSKIKNIGVRHGEKMFETLITNEEMPFSKDMGNFYSISPDNRDLNYDKYFVEGNIMFDSKIEINSNNSKLLSLDMTVEILSRLPLIKSDLNI